MSKAAALGADGFAYLNVTHTAFGSEIQSYDVPPRTLVTGDLDPAQRNRPFDRDRSGFLFSQGGAGVLVLVGVVLDARVDLVEGITGDVGVDVALDAFGNRHNGNSVGKSYWHED